MIANVAAQCTSAALRGVRSALPATRRCHSVRRAPSAARTRAPTRQSFVRLSSSSVHPRQQVEPATSVINDPFASGVHAAHPPKRKHARASDMAHTDATVGFIGTGLITRAVVTGLCTSKAPPKRIVLSPRSSDVGEELVKQFGRTHDITVAPSNQHVVDSSDWVVIATPPSSHAEIVPELKFSKSQMVINFLWSAEHESMKGLVHPAELVRANPLPTAVQHASPTIVYPNVKTVADMFDQVGAAIPVDNPGDLVTLQAATCMMGTYFGAMKGTVDWMEDRGVAKKSAQTFVSMLAQSLGNQGAEANGDFEECLAEQTPGGLNEKVLQHLCKKGFIEGLEGALSLAGNEPNK